MILAMWHCARCGLLYHLGWPSQLPEGGPNCAVCHRRLQWMGGVTVG